MVLIYLAGGIGGLSYQEATGWRSEVSYILGKFSGIGTLDPMRAKESLSGEKTIANTYQALGFTGREIFDRDLADIRSANVLLVNLLPNPTSLGTLFELGYAYSLGKPCVVVCPPHYLDHPFISQSAKYLTTDLYQALAFIQGETWS